MRPIQACGAVIAGCALVVLIAALTGHDTIAGLEFSCGGRFSREHECGDGEIPGRVAFVAALFTVGGLALLLSPRDHPGPPPA